VLKQFCSISNQAPKKAPSPSAGEGVESCITPPQDINMHKKGKKWGLKKKRRRKRNLQGSNNI